ncbi:CHAT domain-containing protein [Streptomyces sp. NPDC050546]|uniref:CHAT domain-containing protein n=1 Tax=Streptomyces sp. NPDC050546 TaxID=3365628 RepID=UPI0037A8BEF5
MATVLELQICQLHPHEYEVRVVKAAAGGESRARLDLNVDDMLAQRAALEDKVLISAAATRRVIPASEQVVQRMGRQLFDALFVGPVSGTYRASLGVARERQERLQIVLRLESPELTLLPWEILFDSHADAYVCRHEPMVRHIPAAYTPTPLPVQPPLRILVVVASPRGLPLLDTDAEREHLEEALAEQVSAGRVELVWLTGATWGSLQTRLMDGPWHVLHFIGHGDYDIRSQEGLIALVGERGGAQMVEASRLADLISEANPTPRLMVLNSCASAQGAVDDGFSSVGATLVRRGISAVAAMQFAVSDRASVRFAQGFYTALAYSRRVDDAVRSGRISMLGASQSLEWITPVLYVRGDASLLFTLPKGPPSERSKQPAEESDQLHARLRILYVMARAELRIGHPGKAIELLDDLLVLDPDSSDAVTLRDQAAKQLQLIQLYDRAAEAEESGDWSSAVNCYEQIILKAPDYRDASARRDFCRTQQRITHLQEELRYHTNEGRWQTALHVSEELTQLDPDSADPDGLAALARQEVEQAQHSARLEGLYAHARAAEHSEDWSAAANYYEQIIRKEADYRDTTARRDFCRTQQRITRLQEKLRFQANEGRWQTVLDLSEELAQLDPDSADPDGLAALARQEVEQVQHSAHLEGLYAHARAAERSEEWSVAIDFYDAIISASRGFEDSEQRRNWCRENRRMAQAGLAGRDSSSTSPTRTLEITIPCGALAWESNGQYLAVDILGEARIGVYDMSGDERLNIKTGKKWAPFVVAYSPDGTRIAGKGRKGVTIWNASTGEKLSHIPTGSEVTTAAFSPDGTCLATGSHDFAYIWDTDTAEKLFWSEQQLVRSVAFSPDGSRLVVADLSGLNVWHITTALNIFEDHTGFLNSVTYSSDGKRVAAGSDGNKARLWSPGHVCDLPHDSGVKSVAFSPNSTLLATGSDDGTARIWDAANTHMICDIHHDDSVLSMAFSPYGTRLATGTQRAVTAWSF